MFNDVTIGQSQFAAQKSCTLSNMTIRCLVTSRRFAVNELKSSCSYTTPPIVVDNKVSRAWRKTVKFSDHAYI